MTETKTSAWKEELSRRLLQAALEYARFGWRVLPVHSTDGSPCSCGASNCKSPGKHPRTKNGLKDATCDPSTIDTWWSWWPQANVGVLTGEKSGIIVLDVDPRHGGDGTLGELQKRYGRLPETLVSKTGGGGQHYYFRYPGYHVRTRQSAVGPGLDLKGDGGYIVAPPSLHRSGERYLWAGDGFSQGAEVADPPAWLLQCIEGSQDAAQSSNCSESGKIAEGTRNNTLASLAGSMRRKGMTLEAIESALLAESRIRCTPPLPDAEVRGIAASVASYPTGIGTKTDGRETPTQGASAIHDSGSDRNSCATQLVHMARSRCTDLFTDDTRTAFVRVPIGSHLETWPLYSKRFEHWIAKQYHAMTGKVPYSQALGDARRVLGGLCEEGAVHSLCNRVGGTWGEIWYDLGDKSWKAVKITVGGWEIIDRPPVIFRRYEHQKPQVTPAANGDPHRILELLNLPEKEGLEVLLMVYLVSCFVPGISHPILVLTGPQGSAKSTFFRLLRAIVDPSATPILSFPGSPQELAQQLQHHWLAYFDNVTGLPLWLSDILCRASTGEGVSKRRLYSDDEDVIYSYRRALGINGIVNPATRPDLLHRCIVVELESIRNGARRTEEELQSAFGERVPFILGGCFDALAKAMVPDAGHVTGRLPRMADFAKRGLHIATALGYDPKRFLDAYWDNIGELNEQAIEGQPFIQAVRALIEEQGGRWEGTASGLLEEVADIAQKIGVRTDEKKWPKSASWVTRRLTEGRINLQADGYEVSVRRKDRNRERTVSIVRRTAGAQ